MVSSERHDQQKITLKLNSYDIEYKFVKRHQSLSEFVESFWMLHNPNESDKEVVVIPDGRIDILFTYFGTETFHIRLAGLQTEPVKVLFPPKTIIFAVSLNLLAAEYLLESGVSDLLDTAKQLPSDFWGIAPDDLNNFDSICEKAAVQIKKNTTVKVDKWKQELFNLIHLSKGSMSVKELSEKVSRSGRQINRYFKTYFGLSLKSYCNIIRFNASFAHLKSGKLFPEENFFDQAHFIREVKNLSGVTPKELFKNKNDRFIQFSVLPKQ